MPRPKATQVKIDPAGYQRIGVKHVHRLVAERALGRPLEPRMVVHHIDEDRTNNVGTNLVICPDRHYHWLLHKRAAALEATGDPNAQRCGHCGKWDAPENLRSRKTPTRTGKNGVSQVWWHAQCLSDYNFRRRHPDDAALGVESSEVSDG